MDLIDVESVRESPILQSFKTNLRKLDLSATLNNNNNCNVTFVPLEFYWFYTCKFLTA